MPEVARLLRPGGLFAFNHEAPLASICWPAGAEHLSQTLALDYFGLHRLEDGQISFQLPHGEWIRLFRSNGFAIEDLIELRPADGCRQHVPGPRGSRMVAPLAGRGDLAAATRLRRTSTANSRHSADAHSR